MKYVVSLVATMALLTAIALVVIRVSYFITWGPDADPNGAYKHYAIDLFGMVIYVGAAALVVWLMKWTITDADRAARSAEHIND